MTTVTLGPTVTLPLSRLLIHTDDNSGASTSWFDVALRRMRSLYTQAIRRNAPLPLGLQIIDLQGHSVFVIESAGPLVTVPLPGGTYHVKARMGDIRRSYTLTIESGALTDLYIRLTS